MKNEIINAELRQQIHDYIRENDLAQNGVAEDIGYSSSVISQYLKGTYGGAIQSLERALKAWIDLKQIIKKSVQIGHVQTTIYTRIYTALSIAQTETEMGFIVAPAGAGKSHAIRKYADKKNNVVIVEGEPGITANQVVRKIGRKCNFYNPLMNDSVGEMKEKLIAHMTGRNFLIIIEEANYLDKKSLEVLRRVFFDQAGAGVFFFGVKALMTNIFLNPQDCDQLQSRIGVFADLSTEKFHFKEAVALANTINEDIKEEIIKQLFKISNHNIRSYIKLLKRILKQVDLDVEKIDDHIIDICRNQILDTANIQRMRA